MFGIFTPYRCDETTFAALRLADLAVTRGLDVKVISTAFHKQQVRSAWDTEVLRGLPGELYTATTKFDTCVHFGVNRGSITSTEFSAKLQAQACEQILVPDRRGMFDAPRHFERYAKIVCPTEDCFNRLTGLGLHAKLTWCRWDSGLPAVQRQGPLTPGEIKALVLCDTATIDGCGALTLETAGQLLHDCPRLSLTLLASKSWSKTERRTLKGLTARYLSRVAVKRLAAFDMLVAELHRHDWLLLPTPRAEFGFVAALALTCGVPVISYAIEPFDGVVLDAYNGFKIPCNRHLSASCSAVALGTVGAWLETCVPALGSVATLLSLQKHDWHLDNRRSLFEAFWDRLWLQSVD